MVDNITYYLLASDINNGSFLVKQNADYEFSISSNEIMMPKIIDQLDRDEEYPIIMNGIKVISKIISQESTQLVVKIIPAK